jgi:anti-sigma regulatory factor (Ser/Thr protein kinase)
LDAPRDARAFVRSTLASWGLSEQAPTVELLTTELVANVVVHVDRPVSIRLVCGRDELRIEVDDSSPLVPELQHPAPDETHGRGILLINSLASRWGTEPRGDGKTVWVELDTTAGGSSG